MCALLISRGNWKMTDPNGNDVETMNTIKSEQTLALIILTLRKGMPIHAEDCNTSWEAWKKLKGIYAKPSTANRMRVYEKLILWLNDVKDACEHVHDITRMQTQLRAVGVEINDILHKLALLRSLLLTFEVSVEEVPRWRCESTSGITRTIQSTRRWQTTGDLLLL